MHLVVARPLFCALALACAFALHEFAPRVSAQQKNDDSYAARIREYTTEKYFLTELVDHLPASERVPSPDKVLGYVVGTPGRLTHTKDVHRYFRELERTSPRVKVFNAPEKSEEGREQILVAVGDDAAIARLGRYKEITARLADPRGLSEAEAQKLIGEGKVFYWASGSIHSPETGSPEMLMEMAYRLAVSESPFIRDIRKNVVVLITPVLEVDGATRWLTSTTTARPTPTGPSRRSSTGASTSRTTTTATDSGWRSRSRATR